MQTRLPEDLRDTEIGREIDAILRSCVHCGFCNATCPTYQLLGDELDGPRGRIYQIKQMLEGQEPGDSTRRHLDRCLTCRSCETTCPSGVEYGRLLDVGRLWLERKHPRGFFARTLRRILNAAFTRPGVFTALLRTGQLMRPLLWGNPRRHIPPYRQAGKWPVKHHRRKMIALAGCVQSDIAPNINTAAAQVLDQLGIELIEVSGAACCGALSHHFAYEEEAREFARTNIDAWWSLVENGVEAIVMTASGCGVQVKDYGHLLRYDREYADKAHRIAALTRDISEILAEEDLGRLNNIRSQKVVAFHPPCTLQHGQKLGGKVESILRKAGFNMVTVKDAHICCGAAGTYSILQSEIAKELRSRKIDALVRGNPVLIATANIGCQVHLQAGTGLPVVHWVELLNG
jgi:glycolate oxidase iron-sulfur subunit